MELKKSVLLNTNKNNNNNKITEFNHIRSHVLNMDSFPQKMFMYLWNGIAAVIAILLFRFFNKTVIEGKSNVRITKNLLLVSNHQTLIDSFFIGSVAFFPRLLRQPSLLPWHPAALENFFGNRFLAFCSKYWKCIPVKRGARDFLALTFMTKALQKGTMILFPEGTRSRSGNLGKGKVGVGKLIHEAHPTVIPVAIAGMNRVLPIGVAIPRVFKLLRIKFGEPLLFEEFYDRECHKETSQEIVDRIMNAIQELKTDIDLKLEKTMNPEQTTKITARVLNVYQRIPLPLLLVFTLGIYAILFFVLI